MKNDPGSNYTIADGLDALSRTVDTYFTSEVDHALAPSVTFHVSCGVWDTSLVATLQNSDDNSVWTDEADATMGNDVSLTLLAAGEGNIHCPNPRARYSRVKVVIGGTCVLGVVSMLGQLRSVQPA